MCHDPHGANGVKLLTKYRPLSENEWVLYGGSSVTLFCMDCHGREFVLADETDRVTAFRNGTQNLHALHVSKKKGRSCKACHDTHAANQPFHIRPNVAFGTAGWKLPITFTRTPTGGACVVGCHKAESYDRVHPAQE